MPLTAMFESWPANTECFSVSGSCHSKPPRSEVLPIIGPAGLQSGRTRKCYPVPDPVTASFYPRSSSKCRDRSSQTKSGPCLSFVTAKIIGAVGVAAQDFFEFPGRIHPGHHILGRQPELSILGLQNRPNVQVRPSPLRFSAKRKIVPVTIPETAVFQIPSAPVTAGSSTKSPRTRETRILDIGEMKNILEDNRCQTLEEIGTGASRSRSVLDCGSPLPLYYAHPEIRWHEVSNEAWVRPRPLSRRHSSG